jgi:hypothetical protein
MKRRIILVDFCWTRDKDPRVPLGHASLLTALRQEAAVEVSPLVFSVSGGGLSPGEVAAAIWAEASGVAPAEVDVALGAYVWGEELLQGVLPSLRALGFGGRLILGGPQISYSGAGLERLYPGVDLFIRGYGEAALAALGRGEEPGSIPGVHVAGAQDQVAQAAVALESLPSPWLSGAIPLEGQRFVRWETQRGCPFRCSFCQHKEAGARLLRRALDLPRVEAEIDLFCASGVEDIAVLDPIFNMGPQAVGVLERFAARGYKGRLSLQCRAEAIDEAFLEAAGALDVRLEFGLQTIHEDEGRAIQRRNNLGRVDAALSAVRARGIAHEVSLIFGLPLQTVARFEASVAWCLERAVPVIKAFPLMLLRGTELEVERARWGFVDSGGAMPMVVESDSFDRAGWREMARLSEALRLTEGRHPNTLHELKALAAGLEPELWRWAPEPNKEAA